jgi:sucrose-6-phosphate hydrolase SacC (GH32 family)
MGQSIGSFDGKSFSSDFKGTRRTMGGQIKAGQLFSHAPDGRAIMMVWARFKPSDPQAPFNQGFTLPIELNLRTASDGVRCYANPVKELKALRKNKLLSVSNKEIKNGRVQMSLDRPEKLVEIELTLSYELDQKPSQVDVIIADTTIHCDLKKNHFRGNSNYPPITSFDAEDGKLTLRIYVDSATVETFAENGAVYFSHNRKQQETIIEAIEIKTKGGQAVVEQLDVYQLKSIWEKK